MRLTIGMPSAGDHVEVWFTVRALQLYQDLRDSEILVVDNAGSEVLKKVCVDLGVRYDRYVEKKGTAPAKNRVFDVAQGDWVICLDSHVLLDPGATDAFRRWTLKNPTCNDLLHGPLVYYGNVTADAMKDEWGTDGKWGVWRNRSVNPQEAPYEIPMHGMGFFACRRTAWLGFNRDFTGFGGEEGYIHTKFRRSGHRPILLPFMRWSHRFRQSGENGTRVVLEDMIRNYVIGSRELGFSIEPLRKKFGDLVAKVEQGVK